MRMDIEKGGERREKKEEEGGERREKRREVVVYRVPAVQQRTCS
jgi:hypothetical protein